MVDFRPAGFEDGFGAFDEDGFMFGDEEVEESVAEKWGNISSGDGVDSPANQPKKGKFGKTTVVTPPTQKTQKQNGTQPRRPIHNAQFFVPVDDYRMAVTKGNTQAAKEYLDQGVPVDTVWRSGWTGLMYAANRANQELVKILLDKGANPNYSKESYYVLMAACSSKMPQKQNIQKCVEMILNRGADVNTHDKYFMTPLMYAAREGHATVVETLLNHGAHIDKQDQRGWTALSWAASGGFVAAVKLLLNRKADPEKRSVEGHRALDIAIDQEREEVEKILEKVTKSGDGCKYPSREEPASLRSFGGLERASGSGDTPSSGGLGGSGFGARGSDVAANAQEPAQKFVKYGELELFLCGIEEKDLIPLFHEHQITFKDFLQLDDRKLEQIGVKRVGTRKKILDGVNAVHKKEWEQGSISSTQYSKQLSCPETIAMVANIAKHTSYIESTILYIRNQISVNPNLFKTGQEGPGYEELCRYTDVSLSNTQVLYTQIAHLRRQLAKLTESDYQPPDLVQPHQKRKRASKRKVVVLLLGFGAIGGLCWWQKNFIIDSLNALSERVWVQE